MTSDITQMDLYALFSVKETSTTQEIASAFRRKAVTCHPDKFPNDNEKKELFLLIKRALEILTDEEARKSYDECWQQKKRQRERLNQMDDKRKKMKETLERNEQKASQTTPATPTNHVSQEKLRAQVERLRREGNRLVIEELAKLDELLEQDKKKSSSKIVHLRIKFLSKTTPYTDNELRSIFSKFGPIATIVNANGKTALIEFQTDQVSKQVENEKGFIDRPFASVKIQGDASSTTFDPFLSTTTTTTTTSRSPKRPGDTIDLTQPDLDDFEAMLFKKISEHAAKS